MFLSYRPLGGEMLKTSLLVLVFSLLLGYGLGAKVVVFNPAITESINKYYIAVGEALAEAGHDVTIFRPEMNRKVNRTHVKKAKLFTFSTGVEEGMEKYIDFAGPSAYEESLAMDLTIDDYKTYFGFYVKACEVTLKNKEAMDLLRQQDIALIWDDAFDWCPFGLVKAAGIPSYIWTSSMSLISTMAWTVGAPSPPSVVPNTMAFFTDDMTYTQRLGNLLSLGFQMKHGDKSSLQWFFEHKYVIGPETELFRKLFGPDFPSLTDIAAQSPLVFVNSEELLDFPRPILHKIVYIGGFNMKQSKSLKMDERWSSIVEKAEDGVVFISFGSVFLSKDMPDSWKAAFLETIGRYPRVTFIWKYEEDTLPGADLHPNLHLTKWAPQNELLAHPNVKLFISHGGQNSVVEAAYGGTPLLLVPLFLDQYGNAMRAVRQKIGKAVLKSQVNADFLTESIRDLLDPEFKQRAQRLAGMIAKKPVKPREQLIKWVSFLAEFKTIPNLQPASLNLSFAQYFQLDILLPLIGLILLSFALIVKSLLWVARKIFCAQKRKPKRE